MPRRIAGSSWAVAGLDPGAAVAQTAPGRGGGQQQAAQEAQESILLGNGEPPALAFQAYPGGTGALLERLWREHGGNPFVREPIEIAPWEGPVPGAEEEIAFLPVHRLAALVRERHISPVELTEIYLERLHRYDPELLFAVTILDARAREEAQQADAEIRAGQWRGPLHGIPWGVKDLFSTRGARTTWGSEDFQNQVIDEDAEIVVRLREAGAVLLAKLATGQFASGDRWFRGQTKNPWNPEQGSSGSSAGPGSATAAGAVAFAIGTETRGSIVSPSRRNGLSALRPTFGRISRYGGMVLAWTMDKPGPMCRTIEDCALVFNAIHGADEKDPATLTAPFRFERNPDLSALRIGYQEVDEDDPEDVPLQEALLEKLREMGADPRPMPPLPDDDYPSRLGVESSAAFEFYVQQQEAAAAAAGEPPQEPDQAGGRGGGGGGGGRFRGGLNVNALEYLQSQRRRHVVMRQMAEVMEDFDMYVSPGGDTGLTNETGHPAVVFPIAFGGDPAQPITTTIVGQLFADDKILSVAHAYQAATDWHTRHPQLG